MDDALNNQVMDTIKYTYLQELNNKCTGLIWVMCCNLLEHIINLHGKIIASYLKANN